jgi:GNAT superfamily N-acetyltransferase
VQQMRDLTEAAVRAEDSFRRTMAGIDNPRGWSRDGVGTFALVTGVNMSAVNGVWVMESDVDLEECRRLLDEVAKRDVPFILQGRAGQREPLDGVASAHDMAFDEVVPLMVLPDLDRPAAESPAELTVRELRSSEFDVHCQLAASAFEAPEEVFRELMNLVSRYPGVRVLVGEVDGSAVTTALTVPAVDRSVGVFNVATPGIHRGKGYGTAVTDYAVSSARQAGARWAWLTSSPEGYNVYSRLGYRTVEHQPVWSRTPSPAD